MLKPGERIGDWIVERPLGEGGMGAVFRVHSALSERVEAALKVMKPSQEPDARARFVREAEALSALRHPAIVRVMGFSEDPRRGLLYLVMELAEGETLKRRLERGAMALPEALATFVPLAAGLEHAHAAGISHRDLKPSNVILTTDGVRLVDFGIAAAAQSGELTGSGHLGTLSYLPPELFRGQRPEPRSIDIYGFGLLLHEALTGVHPFPIEPGLTPAAATAMVGMRKLQHPALDPGEGAPEPLRGVVRRATDPDPSVRPEMSEIRRTLESLVERRAGPMAPAAAPAGRARAAAWSPPADATTRVPDPVVALGERTTTRVRRRFRERRRSVIIAWVASVVAAALLAALVITVVNGRRSGVGGTGVAGGPAGSPPPSPVVPASPSPRARVRATTSTTTSTAPTTTLAAVVAEPTPTPPARSYVPSSTRPSPAPSTRPSPAPSARPAAPAAEPAEAAAPAAPRPHASVGPPTPPARSPAEPPREAEPSPTPTPSPTPSPNVSLP